MFNFESLSWINIFLRFSVCYREHFEMLQTPGKYLKPASQLADLLSWPTAGRGVLPGFTWVVPPEMTSSEKGDSEVQGGHNSELVRLLLVGTVLCILTGWCWYRADTQQVIIPALLWISAVGLLVSVVITRLQLQLRLSLIGSV